jgi:hypothetical protein
VGGQRREHTQHYAKAVSHPQPGHQSRELVKKLVVNNDYQRDDDAVDDENGEHCGE